MTMPDFLSRARALCDAATLKKNPSGMYCQECRDTGLAHCSDPVNCGGMLPVRRATANYFSPDRIRKMLECIEAADAMRTPALVGNRDRVAAYDVLREKVTL